MVGLAEGCLVAGGKDRVGGEALDQIQRGRKDHLPPQQGGAERSVQSLVQGGVERKRVQTGAASRQRPVEARVRARNRLSQEVPCMLPVHRRRECIGISTVPITVKAVLQVGADRVNRLARGEQQSGAEGGAGRDHRGYDARCPAPEAQKCGTVRGGAWLEQRGTIKFRHAFAFSRASPLRHRGEQQSGEHLFILSRAARREEIGHPAVHAAESRCRSRARQVPKPDREAVLATQDLPQAQPPLDALSNARGGSHGDRFDAPVRGARRHAVREFAADHDPDFGPEQRQRRVRSDCDQSHHVHAARPRGLVAQVHADDPLRAVPTHDDRHRTGESVAEQCPLRVGEVAAPSAQETRLRHRRARAMETLAAVLTLPRPPLRGHRGHAGRGWRG